MNRGRHTQTRTHTHPGEGVKVCVGGVYRVLSYHRRYGDIHVSNLLPVNRIFVYAHVFVCACLHACMCVQSRRVETHASHRQGGLTLNPTSH